MPCNGLVAFDPCQRPEDMLLMYLELPAAGAVAAVGLEARLVCLALGSQALPQVLLLGLRQVVATAAGEWPHMCKPAPLCGVQQLFCRQASAR